MAATMRLEAASFDDLAGWQSDDHAAALGCFVKSATVLAESQPDLMKLATAAAGLIVGAGDSTAARAFFEQGFTPHRVVHGGTGFVTGYYEPVLSGRRTPSPGFDVPLYRRPPDLVSLVDDTLRGAVKGELTHGRRTPAGVEPYATRREIEEGALAGQGLEICWLSDPIDAFFLQVQGSGIVQIDGEGSIRVGYDGKNGHPYTSVGKVLIEAGAVSADRMSLDTLREWLAADRSRARAILWHNASFVFFRESPLVIGEGPKGAHDITLTAGRSLAVDASCHRLGLPVHVSAPGLDGGFHRLMVAQDVGSAITGPERGDIFFGTGAEAGQKAGSTRHAARFHVLLPRGAALP